MKVNDFLDQAAKRNIMVFDINASPGVLTKRLVRLIKACFGRNLINGMEFLFVSPEAMKSLTNNDDDEIIIDGVCVFKLDIEDNKRIQDYLEKIGCSPAVGGFGEHLETDQEFVVGSNKNILNLCFDEININNETTCECMLGSI